MATMPKQTVLHQLLLLMLIISANCISNTDFELINCLSETNRGDPLSVEVELKSNAESEFLSECYITCKTLRYPYFELHSLQFGQTKRCVCAIIYRYNPVFNGFLRNNDQVRRDMSLIKNCSATTYPHVEMYMIMQDWLKKLQSYQASNQECSIENDKNQIDLASTDSFLSQLYSDRYEEVEYFAIKLNDVVTFDKFGILYALKSFKSINYEGYFRIFASASSVDIGYTLCNRFKVMRLVFSSFDECHTNGKIISPLNSAWVVINCHKVVRAKTIIIQHSKNIRFANLNILNFMPLSREENRDLLTTEFENLFSFTPITSNCDIITLNNSNKYKIESFGRSSESHANIISHSLYDEVANLHIMYACSIERIQDKHNVHGSITFKTSETRYMHVSKPTFVVERESENRNMDYYNQVVEILQQIKSENCGLLDTSDQVRDDIVSTIRVSSTCIGILLKDKCNLVGFLIHRIGNRQIIPVQSKHHPRLNVHLLKVCHDDLVYSENLKFIKIGGYARTPLGLNPVIDVELPNPIFDPDNPITDELIGKYSTQVTTATTTSAMTDVNISESEENHKKLWEWIKQYFSFQD